jgi:hypothetical protein
MVPLSPSLPQMGEVALVVVGALVVDDVADDARGAGPGGGLFPVLKFLDQPGLQHDGLAHGAGHVGVRV